MWTDRRLIIGIGATSLLLNVFLLGIVLGHVFAGGRHPRPPAHDGRLIALAHVRALPPDERRAFNTALATHRPAIRAAREAHRAARLTTEADIAAPTYDRGKVVSDLGDLRRANDGVGEAVDAALADGLAVLSPAARAALVAHDNAARR